MVIFDFNFALPMGFSQLRLESEQVVLGVPLIVDMTALVSLHVYTPAAPQVAESLSDRGSGTARTNHRDADTLDRPREDKVKCRNIHVMRDRSLRRLLAAIVPQPNTPSFQVEARFHDTAADATLPSRPSQDIAGRAHGRVSGERQFSRGHEDVDGPLVLCRTIRVFVQEGRLR